MLVISCVSFVLFRSKLLLHMLLSLQLLGLASLVEVAWPTPVRVLLESCQYFMVFNIIARGDKLSAGQLFAHNLSRMQIMLQT